MGLCPVPPSIQGLNFSWLDANSVNAVDAHTSALFRHLESLPPVSKEALTAQLIQNENLPELKAMVQNFFERVEAGVENAAMDTTQMGLQNEALLYAAAYRLAFANNKAIQDLSGKLGALIALEPTLSVLDYQAASLHLNHISDGIVQEPQLGVVAVASLIVATFALSCLASNLRPTK
jgi:hypothetical protein